MKHGSRVATAVWVKCCSKRIIAAPSSTLGKIILAYETWREAFAVAGLDIAFYNYRQRSESEIFPWDHIDAAVKKKFMLQDWQWSQNEKTRVDCRDQCFACGILPKFSELRQNTPAEAWECPTVTPKDLRGQMISLEVVV